MEFKRLQLVDFQSYQDQVFDQFDKPGLVLLHGENQDNPAFSSNAAGKSSIWDGIAWCLFGETLRGLKADEVVRWGQRGCSVTLNVTHKGSEYLIRRWRKSGGVELEFIKDTAILTKGTTGLTQAAIEQEFGIDFELFKCTTVFAQGETFNFVDATDKKQKEILSRIMRLKLEQAAVKLEASLRGIEKEIASSQEFCALHRAKIDPEKIKDLEVRQKEWESLQAPKIVALTAEIDGHRKRIDDFEEQAKGLPGAEDLVVRVDGHIKNLQDRRSIENKEVNSLDALQISLNTAVTRLTKVKGHVVCPTCLQTVDQGILDTELLSMKGMLTKAETEFKDASDKLNATAVELDKMGKRKSALNEKISLLRVAKRDAVDARASLNSAVVRLAQIEKEENPFDKMLFEAVETQRLEFAMVLSGETTLLQLTETQAYYDFWKTGFGDQGMKSMVFDIICDTLTNKANHYIGTLTGGQISITFDTQKKLKSGATREKFDCEIIVGGKRVDYASYSGGEKRRISLGVDLALSDLMVDYYGSDFNLVVYDEQDQYMDGVGRKHYLKLLQEVAKKKRVFVVAHDSEFKSMFASSWKIEKSGGISRLAEIV